MHATGYWMYIGATMVGVAAVGVDLALGVQEGVGPALLLSLGAIASLALVDREGQF
jgi:hypothetical protein